MDHNQKEYKKQIEKKLYKYLVSEEQNRDSIYLKEQKKRTKDAVVSNRSIIGSSKESAGLTLETYVPTLYNIQNIIIDSDFISNPAESFNNFTVQLADPIKNVYAIRILFTYFYNSTTNAPINGAFLYLNGYINTLLANGMNTRIYTKLYNNTNVYPAVSSDISMDPYIYIFRPVQSQLNKFNVQIMKSDGTLYNFTNDKINISITLAVYSIPNMAR